jgi:hypothetical protein
MDIVTDRRRPPQALRGAQARPVWHRDADGSERIAPSWESLVERLIREAQEDGRFDDLPGQGQPLVLPDDSAAADHALAYHLLGNAGVSPPWIEADKAVRALEEEIHGLVDRAGPGPSASRGRLLEHIDELLDEHDRAVMRLATLAPSSRLHRRRLDRAALHARLGRDQQSRDG